MTSVEEILKKTHMIHKIKDSKESSYDHKRDNNPYNKTLKQSDHMVSYLISKLGNESTHTPLYRHISWTLPDEVILRIVGSVMDKNPRVPLAYFIACIKRENGYYKQNTH